MELTELEQAVLTMLLAGDDATLVLLRAQLNAATIVSRKMPGVGFFTDFHVPEVVERTAPKDFVIGDVHANLSGLSHGAGFLLFIRDDKLSMLEGFCYGEGQWPSEPRLIEAYYVHHDPPGSPMLRRCAARDLTQLKASWSAR